MGLADDLQVISFREVLEDSSDYRLRWLHRWYSREFHTPLHLVPTLPLLDILIAFWETRYEGFDPQQLDEERQRLLETEEKRRERLLREDIERQEADAFYAETQAQLLEAKKLDDIKTKLPEPVKTREKIPEAALPSPNSEPLPEKISVRFVDSDFFNELIEGVDTQSS